jgi:hypothetical protein
MREKNSMELNEKEELETIFGEERRAQLINHDNDPYSINAAKRKKKDEDDDFDDDEDDFYEEEEEEDENPFDVEPSEDDIVEDEFPDDEDDLFEEEDEDSFR